MSLTSKPLSSRTWPAFARLVEKHNGIFGGCWCISFHLRPEVTRRGAAAYRSMKQELVRTGNAHAALIFDGPDAVGWCQYGPTAELPNIRSRKAYEDGLARLPDWRITCFFIDRDRRMEGIATLALDRALDQISQAGGGVVEAYPEDYAGQKISSSFLCSGTLRLFEKAGFVKTRKIGMHRWVVVRTLPGLGSSLATSTPSEGARTSSRSSRPSSGCPRPPRSPGKNEPSGPRTRATARPKSKAPPSPRS